MKFVSYELNAMFCDNLIFLLSSRISHPFKIFKNSLLIINLYLHCLFDNHKVILLFHKDLDNFLSMSNLQIFQLMYLIKIYKSYYLIITFQVY